MSAVCFDTLKFVETLKESGVPENQAKAISTAVRDSHDAAGLATKADLRAYESAIRGDLEKLEANLRHEMKDLRKDMQAQASDLRKDLDAKIDKLDLRLTGEMTLLKWMMGLLMAGVASLVLKAFF